MVIKPIVLLDNIQNAISKKANYNVNYVPKSLIKLINYISNQNYEPNTLVTGVSGKISNVFYSNSHTPDGGTSLEELIKNDVDFNIIKFNAKSEYSVMFTPDNKKINTTDIINYNEVKNKPRGSAKFYIAYGLPNGKYMLIQIFENEFQYSEYELEQIFSNPNYDSLYKSIETTFNSYRIVREALEKNKDEFGKPSFVTNMIKFFEDNNIYKLKNTRNIAPASYLKVKVNIGLNGYMNTNFIVKDNYISNDVVVKPDTNAEPADGFKRPRGTRGNKKRLEENHLQKNVQELKD